MARKFALNHGLNVTRQETANSTFLLHYKQDYLELIDRQNNTAIHVDFLTGALAHRRKFGGGKGQAIAKAIGMKQYKLPLQVLDVTAGLAKDAFVLACLGCSVTMIERNPVVAELVNYALIKASNAEAFQAIKNQGFELIHNDAMSYLQALKSKPDIIYIDPMYPERKKSAAVKKNMQMLQNLLGHSAHKESEENELLKLALTRAKKRVVIKRPKGAPCLSDKKPTTSIDTKTTRYDVYVLT